MRIFKLLNITKTVCVFGFLVFYSCSKDKKGCWDSWAKGSLQPNINGTICDKTKEEAEAMQPNFHFSKKGAPRYCWLISTNQRFSCVPESVIVDALKGTSITYTKEACSSTCP